MSVGEAMTESAPGGTRFRMPPALDMSLLRRTVDFDDPKYSRALQVTDMSNPPLQWREWAGRFCVCCRCVSVPCEGDPLQPFGVARAAVGATVKLCVDSLRVVFKTTRRWLFWWWWWLDTARTN